MSLPTAKRFTIAEYHKLSELGFFQEDDRIELIHGELITMAAKGTLHEVCLTRLIRELPKLVGDRVTIRVQSPVVLSEKSEPEPDLSLVINRDDDYINSHPSASDILLTIEISDSSLTYDQTLKASLYAEAGIAEYWIFNLVDKHLEVYREPYHDFQSKFAYRIREIFLPNQVIALPHLPELSLDLNQVFPILK